MTRVEKERNERPWLRVERLVVPRRLKRTLDKDSSLNLDEKRDYAWIVSKVITESENLGRFTNIYSKDLKKGLNGGVTERKKWLVENKFLEVNRSYSHGKSDPSQNFSMSYRLYGFNEKHRYSRLVVMEFPIPKFVVPDDSSRPQNDVSRYILECLQQLSVRRELVEVKRPDRSVMSLEVSKNVFGKKFDLKSGTNVRRLFHTVITGVGEARFNLILERTKENLCYVDLTACHPNLLVKWMVNDGERSRYVSTLQNDLYEVVKQDMNLKWNRSVIKRKVSMFLSDKEHKQGSFFGKWIQKRFPILHQDLMGNPNMAKNLQDLEAVIFVERLGELAMSRKLFYVSMHDGFLCLPKDSSEFVTQAKVIFKELLGHEPSFKVTPLTPEEFYRQQKAGKFNRS